MAVHSINQGDENFPSELLEAQQKDNQVDSQSEEAAFHTAVILLAVVALTVIITATLLTFLGKTISDGVLAIGSTGIGGLAGIVVPKAKNSQQAIKRKAKYHHHTCSK